MLEQDALAERFEKHRPHLRVVAQRILGSAGDADDAVQEAWLRLVRSDVERIENLAGWLTTVVARICLNMLRARPTHREVPLHLHLADSIEDDAADAGPESQALLADEVSAALLVVLQTLAPAERLAFVLHDMFAMPFTEIALILERSPQAARQLASRARRRVRGDHPPGDPAALHRDRGVVEAFLAAAREGSIEGLLAALDPDVVLRADTGTARTSREVRGASSVAGQALAFSRIGGPGDDSRPALIDGRVGQLSLRDGSLIAVLVFSVAAGRIAEIDILADPERLAEIDVPPTM